MKFRRRLMIWVDSYRVFTKIEFIEIFTPKLLEKTYFQALNLKICQSDQNRLRSLNVPS